MLWPRDDCRFEDWVSTDEFLRSDARCKELAQALHHKLSPCAQAWNVAKNQFVSVDRGRRWGAQREVLARRWRNEHGCRQSRSLPLFRDADVGGETRYVEPIHNGEIGECEENDDYSDEPRWSHLNESERQGNGTSGHAEGYEVRKTRPGAHGCDRARAFPQKSDGCG